MTKEEIVDIIKHAIETSRHFKRYSH
jgi:hypothetical protein